MTALTIEASRACSGGIVRRVPLAASANPFVGSLLSINSAGYAVELTAGGPFLGIAEKSVPTKDVGASAGDVRVECRSGIFVGIMALIGVAQDDVLHRRAVFASDDNVLTFTAKENTLVGYVIGVEATNTAIIQFVTADSQMKGSGGVKSIAATGAQTLTTADLNKVILLPNTAALALTLPSAVKCAGGSFIFKKTTTDAQAVTVTGAGAETIDGANTHATMDAQYDTITIVSDGVVWHVVASKIS